MADQENPQPCLRIQATTWQLDGDRLVVTADLSRAISAFGPGIYTVTLPYVVINGKAYLRLNTPSVFFASTPAVAYSFFLR